MNKPELKTLTVQYLSWIECREYIKEKYNISDKKIQNFWKYIVEYNHADVNFTFDIEERPYSESLGELWDLFNNEFDLETAKFMNIYD